MILHKPSTVTNVTADVITDQQCSSRNVNLGESAFNADTDNIIAHMFQPTISVAPTITGRMPLQSTLNNYCNFTINFILYKCSTLIAFNFNSL
jgi:hypothetical protein